MTAPSLPQLDDDNAETILGEIAGADNSLKRWNEFGSITVDMFGWLFEGVTVGETYEAGIMEFIPEEFDFFQYHQILRGCVGTKDDIWADCPAGPAELRPLTSVRHTSTRPTTMQLVDFQMPCLAAVETQFRSDEKRWIIGWLRDPSDC